MTDAPLLALAVAVPWALGVVIAALLDWRVPRAPGRIAMTLGSGWPLGALALTLILRALDTLAIGVDRTAVVTVAAVAVALVIAAMWRYAGRVRAAAVALASAAAGRTQGGWARVVWLVLLAWIALHFVLLLAEVLQRPLYPWEAWTRWAPYAKVLYAIHAIPRFVDADTWMRAGTGVWFDAAPHAPATVGLLQAWTALLLGRFDDAAMNVPWVATLAALGLVIHAGLRRGGIAPVVALAATAFVIALPLPDTHVALAGYPDLFAAVAFAAGVCALCDFVATRTRAALLRCGLLALVIPAFHPAGAPLTLALALGIAVALLGRRAVMALGPLVGILVLVVIALARTTVPVAGHALHLEYRPDFGALAEATFLLGSFGLLWYAVIGALLLGRRIVTGAPWQPLAVVLATAAVWVALLALFPSLRTAGGLVFTVERALLMLGPAAAIIAARVLADWVRAGPATLATDPVATAAADAGPPVAAAEPTAASPPA